MPLTSMKRVLTLVVLRLYPPHWRARYGAEMRDLIETCGIGWAGLADLLWCGVEEWTHSDPERREGPAAEARRMVTALVASVVTAAVTTGVWLLLFLAYVVAVRWRVDGDVLWVVGWLLRSGWPYAVDVWFTYSVVFACPAIALCRCTGVGRRWPAIARLVTMASFVSFTAWLPLALTVEVMPYPIKLLTAATAGWALAAVLFPIRRKTHGILVPMS